MPRFMSAACHYQKMRWSHCGARGMLSVSVLSLQPHTALRKGITEQEHMKQHSKS